MLVSWRVTHTNWCLLKSYQISTQQHKTRIILGTTARLCPKKTIRHSEWTIKKYQHFLVPEMDWNGMKWMYSPMQAVHNACVRESRECHKRVLEGRHSTFLFRCLTMNDETIKTHSISTVLLYAQQCLWDITVRWQMRFTTAAALGLLEVNGWSLTFNCLSWFGGSVSLEGWSKKLLCKELFHSN